MWSRRALAIALLVQVALSMGFADSRCSAAALKTPAVYIEHVGDEDKPIYPIAMTATRMNGQEARCALSHQFLAVKPFRVTEAELGRASELLRQSGSPSKRTKEPAEFRYVIVSTRRTVMIGFLNFDQSKKALANMAKYLNLRQPELHDRLVLIIRQFAGM